MSVAQFNAATALGVAIAVESDKLYQRQGPGSVCALQFQSNGNLEHDAVSSGAKTGADPGADEWLRGNPIASVGDDWEMRCTVTDGALFSGPVNTWTSLSGTLNTFDVVAPGNAELTVEFRRAGQTSIVASASQIRLVAVPTV